MKWELKLPTASVLSWERISSFHNYYPLLSEQNLFKIPIQILDYFSCVFNLLFYSVSVFVYICFSFWFLLLYFVGIKFWSMSWILLHNCHVPVWETGNDQVKRILLNTLILWPIKLSVTSCLTRTGHNIAQLSCRNNNDLVPA